VSYCDTDNLECRRAQKKQILASRFHTTILRFNLVRFSFNYHLGAEVDYQLFILSVTISRLTSFTHHHHVRNQDQLRLFGNAHINVHHLRLRPDRCVREEHAVLWPMRPPPMPGAQGGNYREVALVVRPLWDRKGRLFVG